MKNQILQLIDQALRQIKEAIDLTALENLRRVYLARRTGQINKILRQIKFLPVEEKKEIGFLANQSPILDRLKPQSPLIKKYPPVYVGLEKEDEYNQVLAFPRAK